MASVYYEEGDPALKYSYTGWETVNSSDFHGTGARRTLSPSAWVSLTFEGSAVSFIGSEGEDHGDIEVNLDGRSTAIDGRGVSRHQVVQFHANQLSTGLHSIQVLNLRNMRGKDRTVLDIDAFLVTPHAIVSKHPQATEIIHAWYFIVVIFTATALYLNYLWHRRPKSSKQNASDVESIPEILPPRALPPPFSFPSFPPTAIGIRHPSPVEISPTTEKFVV